MDAFLKKYSEKSKTEDVRFVSEKNIFKFGKYKDKTFEYVFNTDKNYVIWVLKNDAPDQRKFYMKPYLYFKDRIENDAEN